MSSAIPGFETLVQAIRWRAKRHGERRAATFLREGEEEFASWTYAEVDRRARAVAAALLARNAGGCPVLLIYPSGLDFIAGFLGCLYAGAIAVPSAVPRVHRNLGRLEAIVKNAGTIHALTTTAVLERIRPMLAGSTLENLAWLPTDTVDPELAEQWREPELNGETVAFLQYTSGSTAQPKGVIVSHRNLIANHQMHQAAFGETEDSTCILWLPLFHDMGLIGSLLQTLFTGGHCVLMPPEAFITRPIRWLRAVSRYRAHTSGGPNFAYDLCVRKITPEQAAQLDLSSWVNAFNAAEPVRAATLARFQTAFAASGFRADMHMPCYGLAEATLFVSGGPSTVEPLILTVCTEALGKDQITPPVSEVTTRELVSCGRGWGDERICIVNPDTCEVCEPGAVGEIWLAGSHISAGYWRQPEESARTFHAALAGASERIFLRTGDLGFLHHDELFVTGRCKDLIIIAGRNHYPADLEQTVEASHPLLRPACSAAFSILEEEERLVIVAEIERTARNGIHLQEIELAIRRAISEEHSLMIETVVLLPPASILKTSSGKIRRAACRDAFFKKTLPVLELTAG